MGTTSSTTSTWRDRAPRSLTDPNDSRGEPCPTLPDRRWLWRLEGFLAVSATNGTQRQMGRDLHEYLNETCEHHFVGYTPDPGEAPIRQCIWCHWTEWQTANGWAA